VNRHKLSGVATAMVVSALLTLPADIVVTPAHATPGVGAFVASEASLPPLPNDRPPPPPPPGCAPDSTDPACQLHRYKCGFVGFPIYCWRYGEAAEVP
jgi:hypothetical protein